MLNIIFMDSRETKQSSVTKSSKEPQSCTIFMFLGLRGHLDDYLILC